MSYTVGSLVKGTISTVAFGGKGILRTEDNLVIFIPFTAPQDEVICRLTKVKKNYGEAQLVEVVRPSSLRTIPRCPYFGKCGGCQLQHIVYQEQMTIKEQAIKDALRKFAEQLSFPFTMHAAEKQWDYRRHIYLTLKDSKVGYIANDYSFLPVDVCPIFIPLDSPIIIEVQEVVANITSEGKVMIAKQSDGSFLLHFHFKEPLSHDINILKKAKDNHPHWGKLLISTIGNETLLTQIGSLSIHYSSSSFMQNHPDESLKIYQKLLSIAESEKPKQILDLYCGIGISTLMLAPTATKILGIEENSTAIELAKKNAKENKITNAHFKKCKVEYLPKEILNETWDFILVNPPREGLAKEVPSMLLDCKPKNMLYVSCMPSTLARDLKIFLENGYEIRECHGFDMFPQTTHVETLIHLQQSGMKSVKSMGLPV